MSNKVINERCETYEPTPGAPRWCFNCGEFYQWHDEDDVNNENKEED